MSLDHHHNHEGAITKELAWKHAWQHPFVNDPNGWIRSADTSTLEKSFGNEGGIIMCIDEGEEPLPGEDAVYLAGAGILYMKHQIKNLDERRKHLVDHLRGKKIKGVRSHRSCGACALHCKECGEGEPEMTAQEWAKLLAQDLDVPYTGHTKKLRRPEFHNALVAYYDGTGRFKDPSLSGLPPGFIVSRAYIPDADHAAYELELASQIAAGAHGFEGRFTPDQPFHFVAVWSPSNRELTEDRLMSEIHPIVSRNRASTVTLLRQPEMAAALELGPALSL